MSRIAVIVIDVQQMFFSGPAAAYRASDVIDRHSSASAKKRIRSREAARIGDSAGAAEPA